MAQTTPPTITPAPSPAPDRSSRSTFSGRVDAFVTWVSAAVAQFLALATNVYNNAVDCYNNAVAALGYASAAANSATSASGYANNAANSALDAAAAAGATAWVSGTTYAIGDSRFSLIDNRTYRRRTIGAGTIDPSIDQTNWASLAGSGTQIYSGVVNLLWQNAFFNTSGSVAVPDLSIAPRSFGLTTLSNSVAVPSTITTSDGWSVATGFSAGTLKTIAPLVTATPHAWWGNLTMTPPVTSTIPVGVAPTNTYPLASAVLSSTCHVMAYYDASNIYIVAYDPTTGLVGGVQTFAFSSTNYPSCSLFAVSSTSFVLFASNGGATGKALAGSLSGLTITLGSALALASALDTSTPVQLTASTFLIPMLTATGLQVISVSGTTCSAGTAVASGNPSTANTKLAFITSTTVLVGYPASAASACEHTFRVASISGTTITMNATASTSTTAALHPANTAGNMLHTMAVGGPYLYCARDNVTSSTGHWFGITVSGTTVTIGADSLQASIMARNYRNATYAYKWAFDLSSNHGLSFMPISATKCLIASNSASAYVVSISGTTLTFGAAFSSLAGAAALISDVATGLNTYLVGTNTLAKISVSGTTISSVWTITASTANVVMFSDTLSNSSVSYSGTWYAWQSPPTAHYPISPTKFLNVTGATYTIYGEFY